MQYFIAKFVQSVHVFGINGQKTTTNSNIVGSHQMVRPMGLFKKIEPPNFEVVNDTPSFYHIIHS